MRQRLRAVGFVALAIVAITCTDAPTSPTRIKPSPSGVANVRMSPSFSAEAARIYSGLAAFGLEVTEVHVVLTGPDGSKKDTVIAFPVSQDQITIEIPVPSSGTDQAFDALIELRNDQHVVLFSGRQTVIARAANLPTQNPPLVVISYTGPGKGAKTVTVSPPDTTIAGTATVAIKATAVDSAGLPVSNLLVRFAVSDATLAVATSTGDATGTLTGLGKRGVAIVSAITPLGIAGSSRITFVPPPARIVVISGNGQTGVAGSALAQPVVVEVQATDNLPVPGATVTFRAVTAGGSVQQATVIAGANGRASTTLTLGQLAGAYVYEAGSGALTPVSVSATATPAPAAAIAIVSGDAQTDTVGKTLAQPFLVKVTDQFGGAVGGATVTWTKVAGNGVLGAPSTITGANGTTSIAYVLGATASSDTIRASVAGVTSSVLFSARSVTRSPAAIAIVSGGNQSGLPNTTLPTPLVARVADAQNVPIANATVTWSAVGAGVTFNPVSSLTDALGNVSTQATLGATPGSTTVTATVGTATATTTLTTTTPTQPTLTIVAGNQQSAVAGATVPIAPSVLLKDGLGNPTANAQVTFAVASGGGSVTGGTATTNNSGVATLGSWTLGATPGPNTLTATSGTLSVTFTATGTSPTIPNHFGFAQPVPTQFIIGAPAVTIAVRLLDPTNDPVAQPGIVVTLTGVVSPGPNFPVLTATTDNTGLATFTVPTYNGPAGTVTITASATGITPVSSPATPIVAPSAAQLLITTQPPATSINQAPFVPQPVVQLADANGNPVNTAGVQVIATFASGPTSPTPVLIQAGATTNASGQATFAGMAINGPFGTYALSFAAPGVAPVVSNAIVNGAGPANTLLLFGGNGQNAPVSTPVAVPPIAKVIDAQGNGVPGVVVTFTAVNPGSTVANGTTTGTAVTVTTNSFGNAQLTAWTMSPTAGAHTVTASATVPNGSPVTFTATATATGPSKFILLSPFPTQITVGAPQPSIDIQIADANNNPVQQAGVSVNFNGNVQPGGFNFNFTLSTNAQGIINLTQSPYVGQVGNEIITIAAQGFTTLTSPPIPVVAGAPSALRFSSQPSTSAQSGVPFTGQPSVRVVDQGGNTVPTAGIPVTATVSGATLSGTMTVNTNTGGVAVFTDLALAGPTGPYNLVFTSPSLNSVTSVTINLAAGTAASMSISAGNNQTVPAGTSVPILPAVLVKDAGGNPVAGVDVLFTAVTPNSFIDDVQSTTIPTNAQGIAAPQFFWQVSTTAGTNTLTASAAGVAGSPLTFTAIGTPGPAADMRLLQPVPASITVGQPFPAPVQVQLVDGNSNNVAQGGVTITATANVQPSNTTFALNATTASNGLATFTLPTYVGTIGTMTFTLTAPSINTLVTPAITVLAGAPNKLVITTQPPTTASSGLAFTPQPSVQVTDVGSNAVNTTTNVAATIASGSGTLGGTTTIPTSASGLATFGNLALSGAPGSFTLRFAASGLTAAVSTNIALGAGGPAAVTIFAGDQQVAAAGTSVAIAPSVRVTDGQGTPLAGVAVTFAPTLGGGSTPPGNVLTNASGIATSGGWQLGTAVGTNNLTASVGALSATFTATAVAGPASRLAFVTPPPPTAASGIALSPQPSVQLQDNFGNPVSSGGVLVGASVQSGSGTLTNATATTTTGGLATFSGLTITGPANGVTLDFNSAGLNHIASSPITVGAGGPSTIAISAGNNQTAAAGATVATAPSVLITDGAGNPVGGVPVTFNATVGSGQVTGSSTITNASGIAAVGSWRLGTTAGANALTATAGALSTTFSATAIAGPAAQLALITTPSASAQSGVPLTQQPTVQLQDQLGNAVAGSGTSITAAVLSGSGTLTNTTATTNASGLATFSGLTITGPAGSLSLEFMSGSLTHAVSSPITLSSGAPAAIAKQAGDGQTATVATAVAIAPSVRVTDGTGNPVPGVPVTFTVASGGGGVTGSPATTNASGIATVGAWQLGSIAGANSLTATTGALSTTFTATSVAGTASQLGVVTPPPTSAASGVALTPQPSLQRLDQFGNAVAGAGFVVTASVNTGVGTLTNATATTNAAGLATFSGLTITGPAGTLTLAFTSPAVSGVVPAPITLSGGAAAAITKQAGDGQTAIVASNVAVDPAVLVTDGAGNPVVGVQVTFTVASGGGSVTGTPATTNASGIAQVSAWQLGTIAGPNSLTATLGALTTTFTATGVAAPPAALSFTTQPPTTSASGSPLSPQPVIQVRDAFGNATAATGTVTAVITAGTGTLNNATATIGAGGVATFSALTINGSGTFTLQFQSGSLTPVSSSPITQAAGPAANIVFSVSPTAGTGGVSFSPAVTVRLVDAQSNTVTSNNTNTVVLSIAPGTGTAGATLAGAGPVTFVNGVATFPSAAIDFGGTGYALRATTNALNQAGAPIPFTTSGTFSITPGPSQLLITKPGNRVSVAQVGASSPPTVTRPIFVARNAQGQPAPGLTVDVTAFGRCRLLNGQLLPFTTLTFTSDANGEVTPNVQLPTTPTGSGCLIKASGATFTTATDSSQIAVFPAQTSHVWTGAVNSVWTNAANWIPVISVPSVPSSTSDNVFIPNYNPQGLPVVPVVSGPKPAMNRLTLDSLAQISLGNIGIDIGSGGVAGWGLTNSGSIHMAATATVNGIFDILDAGQNGVCGTVAAQIISLRDVSANVLNVRCKTNIDTTTVVANTINVIPNNGQGWLHLTSSRAALAVSGNANFTGDSLWVTGGVISVTGTATFAGSDVNWSGGTLNATSTAVFASNHALYNSMQMILQGDATFGGPGSGNQQLAGGQMTVLGNFTQVTGIVGGPGGLTFNTSSDHASVFAGSTPQIVSFANPAQSKFSVLHLQNTSAGGVQLATSAQIVNGTTQPRVDIFTGRLQLNAGTTFTVNSGGVHLGPSTNLNLLGNIAGVISCTGRTTNSATITGTGLFNGAAYGPATCTP